MPPVPPLTRTSRRSAAAPSTNHLLAKLPRGVRAALAPHLVAMRLENGQVLFEPSAPMRWAYFPDSAVVSIVAEMSDGEVAEAGTVGREGFAGLPLVFGLDASPFKCFVQVAGDARRISVTALRRLTREHAPLRALLLKFAHTYLCQVAQSAACNALHPIGARCARWLLMTDDRARGGQRLDGGPGSFALTQEALAVMLGVRREGVSAAARGLRSAGLIDFARGRVTVLDRRSLEQASCECYVVVSDEHRRVLG